MPIDILGNSVSDAAPGTLSALEDFAQGFLAYETRAIRVLDVADSAAHHCLTQVFCGYLFMFLETPEAPSKAAPFLSRAEAAARGATPRELGHLQFLKAWVAEDIPAALGLAQDHLVRFPRDLVLAKLAQYHAFNLGDAAGMLRFAHQVLPAADDVPYAHGMAAFAYEQCHLLEEAEAAARRAMALKRAEPWAHHALAHVMLTQGRVSEGAQFMAEMSATWSGLNSFMSTHNWWHLALFLLSEGRDQDVLAIYDRHVWGIDPTYSQDQVGAVSLLARLELAGVDVGPRWERLQPFLVLRAEDNAQPFLALQYLYGLARLQRPEAQALAAAIRRRAEAAPAFCRAAWVDVAVPAAEGLLAHAAGDFARAAQSLGLALPHLQLIGGSHAQRDLFEQIWLDALIRSGAYAAAQQVLELRRRHDPDGVPLNRRLADLYRRLGLPAEALVADGRAARTLGRAGARVAS